MNGGDLKIESNTKEELREQEKGKIQYMSVYKWSTDIDKFRISSHVTHELGLGG